MSKVTVTHEFNLPEEEEILKMLNQHLESFLAIEEIRDFLREKIKYANLGDEADNVLFQIKEMLPEEF